MPRGVARDHDEKRAALRKGAARYFAEHGFDRASMTGAAKACGVSKALLYHYYDGKEALLFDILEDHLGALADRAEAAEGGIDGLIHAILSAYADADAEHKLQIDALNALPEDMRAPLVALQRRLVSAMGTAVCALRPDLGADQRRAAVMSVFGMLNWVFMWHRPDKGLSREAYADLAADFVTAGLAGLPQGGA